MEREQVFAAVAGERRSIAALIDDLDRDQLATVSLCAGWDVKTVAAHLVSDFADLVARVLDFLTGPTQLGFFSRRRLRGIALHDDDTGRTWGHGDPIRGPGAAAMLAVCGRTVAFDRLTGSGLNVLQSRLS